jgi:alpha-L-fucosidase
LAVVILLGAAAGPLWGTKTETPGKRNIVFVLSDDHRYDFMGFMKGAPSFLETPNLDRMAREGAHVANAFVSTSLCSPSRASILTGQYMHHHRIVDNQRPEPGGTVFFPQVLQKSGYRTAFVGKWHMGQDLRPVPAGASGPVHLPDRMPSGRGRPSAEQVAWHEMEMTMFLHFSPATWQNREYDNHSTPLEEINPEQLDTDQWCEVAQSFDAKQIVFVAKHVGDFCWWRTDTTDYGIKDTPWRNGQGDVLGDLAESCRKYGLKLGIYVYPGNEKLGAGIGSGGRTQDPAKQPEATRIFRRQLTETLSKYGPIGEVWFDGSCVIDVSDILAEHAPKAMVFQGPQATIRWPGNEEGIAPYPAWQTVNSQTAPKGTATGRHSDPDGDTWLPMEMDTTLLNKAWFWKADWDHRIKPLEELMRIYYASVGRGCVLLLNASPDPTGRIPDAHVRRYREFGNAVRNIYANPKGETAGLGRTLELRFDQPTQLNHIITKEDIRRGHSIRAYRVEGLINGAWHTLVAGSSVGHKKIDVIETRTVAALCLRITEAVTEPMIKSFAAYEAPALGTETAAPESASGVWQRMAQGKDLVLAPQWRIIDIDLTSFIRAPGQYALELRQTGGTGTLQVRRAVAVMADQEAPRLTEALDRPHAWNINRTAEVTPDNDGRTRFRIEARSVDGASWTGTAYLKRMR